MVNSNRIVPNTAIDLLTNYSVILNASGKELVKVSADSPGEFKIGELLAGNLFFDEPVKSVSFAADTANVTMYFVAAYDFEGFKEGDSDIAVEGNIDPDGRTLYKAVISNGTAQITAVGL